MKNLNTERTLAVHGLWEPVYEKGGGTMKLSGLFALGYLPKRLGARARNSRTNEQSPLTAMRLDKLAQEISDNMMALYLFVSDVWESKARRKVAAKALGEQLLKRPVQ